MDKKTYVIKMAVLSKLTMDFDNCIFKILWRKTKKKPYGQHNIEKQIWRTYTT